MRKKAIYMILLVAFSSFTIFSSFAVKPAKAYTLGENTVSYVNLLPGDILIGGAEKPIYDFIVPGDHAHSEVYMGLVGENEQIWDRINDCWMAEGTPYVLEATKGANPEEYGNGDLENGLGYSPFDITFNERFRDVIVLRVLDDDGTLLSAAEVESALDWGRNRLTGGWDGYPVGPEYDINWLSKDAYGSKYHCSEFCWAIYYAALGINIDADMSPFNIAVSPDDLWMSQYTSVIACQQGDGTDGDGINAFNCSGDLSLVTMTVPWMYYYNDYDGFGLGAGEMFLVTVAGMEWYFDGVGEMAGSTSGSGYMGTEASADEYLTTAPLGWCPFYGFFNQLNPIKIDSGNYWSYGAGDCAVIHALVDNAQDLRLQVEAYENDVIGYDWYPIFQDIQEPAEWNDRIDQGVYEVNSNNGDCYYHVHYEIESTSY